MSIHIRGSEVCPGEYIRRQKLQEGRLFVGTKAPQRIAREEPSLLNRRLLLNVEDPGGV